jgi:muramoyltetrapeptide carboxypeptidase
MITPPYLKIGDKVAIVATARKISPAEVLPAIRIYRGWGLEVIEGEHLYAAADQFAGSDEERLADLQVALDDDSIRAVICARGGYGTVRIIDQIDFSRFAKNPKWIVGYSDVTVLHSHIHRHFGIETLHALMPVNFRDLFDSTPPVFTMKRALLGTSLDYELPGEPLNRKGACKGLLTGGNLSILYSLSGTASDIDTRGKVLFLEDVDEYLYHIDRMMMNLKRTGKLDHLAGLIVGSMAKMRDNEVPFGKTAYEIIAGAVADYSYPVCFNFPAGHQEDNRALILGREVVLEISSAVSLSF